MNIFPIYFFGVSQGSMTIAIFRIRRPLSQLQDVRVPALSMEITAAAGQVEKVEED